MSHFILDEQLAVNEVLGPLRKHLKTQRLVELRPGERILDDRIPEILLTLTKPTFITLDSHFWKMALCHADYSIFYFALPEDDQDQVPKLLLRSLKLDPLKTRAKRMGRVVRVAKAGIQYWQCGSRSLHLVPWDS
jgi:hypothetical protein